MPFIRLCDNYVDHPKIDKLGDGAFRLWHQGLAFCRRFQTDGMIPFTSVRGLKAYSPKRARELCEPWQHGATALWIEEPGFGYRVHDYLEWNPTRDEENERRAESKERMRVIRERRRTPGVAPVRANTAQTHTERARDVLDREKDRKGFVREKGSGEKPAAVVTAEDLGDRARELLEHYGEWYREWRHGARLPISFSALQFQDACTLCATWDDARLEKLARIVLTTDDPFIAGTDRGFKIFALKASWADDRLRQWETSNGVAV